MGVWKQVGGERDVPRWVVIAGLVATVLSALVAWRTGRDPLEEQIAALHAEREHLGVASQPEPIDYDGSPYEVGEHLHEIETAEARFPTDRITWWVDPAGVDLIRPAVTTADVREAMRAAWSLWAVRLQVEPVEVQREADALVVHRFGFIDGPSRTLAWSTLTDGSQRQQHQRYDTGERWTLGPPAPGQISLPVVAAHEIGHAMGQGHLASGSGALMQPYYSSQVTAPTELDIAALVRLGYKRRTEPPPGEPGGGILTVPARLNVDDVVRELQKLGYGVTPPKR